MNIQSLWTNEPQRHFSDKKLGAFLGVFTPTILTILGVIMYLRFGWVLGQVGLAKTFLIVIIANSITLLTTLSLSAIATNSHVGVGGAYYMIFRSLGLEIGGAIGFPLFFSQALSVTLYAFGLAESLRFVWPEIPVSLAAFIIVLLVAIVSLRGAAFALKSQIPVMVLIGLSLLMLIFGAFSGPPVSSQLEMPQDFPKADFWSVFAVFFPAVTGIMAGLGLSGDLKNPRQSIPRGSVVATLVGFVIYLLIPVVLYHAADTKSLLADPLIWTRIAMFGPWLILPGLCGAIFSSAVGSMLGAPRTLQALAMDRLLPVRRLGLGKAGMDLRWGFGLTVGLSLSAVFLGDLNAVATVATMFFLSVYGTINMVAALEQISGNPHWRPTLHIPWYLCLAGGLGSFGAMLLIHWPATVFAISVEILIWLILKRQFRKEAWGDLRRDLYEALIRWSLIRLADRPMTARNWRPHMLVFVSNVEKRLDLARFGAWFNESRGVVTICELVNGDLLDLNLDTRLRQREINSILKREGIIAFGEVNVVQDIERGILAVAQANGMAGMDSNTVLVGWPDDERRLIAFLRVIKRLKCLEQSLILGKVNPLQRFEEGKLNEIHVWWGGLKRNGDLMLLLAYLLNRNPAWRYARIRILSIASNDLMKTQTERFLAQLIPEIRIDAEVDVMVKAESESVVDIMHRESAAADVVLLGLATPDQGAEEKYAERLAELAAGMPTCFFVHNGSLFIGDLVTPEMPAEVDQP
ncbi:MAG: Na-K-Cl cotransporter [Deltaproteobacteria bacterium]|jgi:amino acid transporter|nr:Na-K-Cl cotransporter [Deltaproteobacteria bacterium]